MSPAPIRLDGQVAIVTGAGHGLGRAYAVALAARGARVVCNDVAGERAHEAAREIVAAGGQAVAETSSVATADGGAAIVEAALRAFGSVQILVSNAGQLRNAAFDEMAVDDWRQVIDTHLSGAFYVTQPAYRHMRTAGYGRIVFASSSAGLFPSPWQANYGAAKAGLVGLCNVVALEGAAHGIVANSILPMAFTGIGEGGPPAYAPEQMQATMDALGPLIPRMTVEQCAPLVVYLASARCTESGRVLSVGCGHVGHAFVGAARPWFAPGPDVMTPEDVEAILAVACDRTAYEVPESMNDHSRFLARHLPE